MGRIIDIVKTSKIVPVDGRWDVVVDDGDGVAKRGRRERIRRLTSSAQSSPVQLRSAPNALISLLVIPARVDCSIPSQPSAAHSINLYVKVWEEAEPYRP